jgi:hypothetical protein
VTQADIVSNKRLGDVLQRTQAKQRKRDGERLAGKSVTLRLWCRGETAQLEIPIRPHSALGYRPPAPEIIVPGAELPMNREAA